MSCFVGLNPEQREAEKNSNIIQGLSACLGCVSIFSVLGQTKYNLRDHQLGLLYFYFKTRRLSPLLPHVLSPVWAYSLLSYFSISPDIWLCKSSSGCSRRALIVFDRQWVAGWDKQKRVTTTKAVFESAFTLRSKGVFASLHFLILLLNEEHKRGCSFYHRDSVKSFCLVMLLGCCLKLLHKYRPQHWLCVSVLLFTLRQLYLNFTATRLHTWNPLLVLFPPLVPILPTHYALKLIFRSPCFCLADDMNGYQPHASPSSGSLQQGQSEVNTKPTTCSHSLSTFIEQFPLCNYFGVDIGKGDGCHFNINL